MSKRRGHGEGAIYRRTDGRWVASVDLGWDAGRRRRKSVYGKTRTDVAARLTKLLAEQQNGRPAVPEALTVGSFLESWLEDAIRPRVRPKTYYSFEQIVRTHLIPGLGKHRLNKLTPQHVRQFINAKQAAGYTRIPGYALGLLRRALRYGEAEGLVARNVASLVDSPAATVTEIEPYDETEARAFLNAVKGDRLEAVYAVAIGVGLRRGEALALTWEDIDLDEGLLTVRRQLQRVAGKLVFSEPKTAKSKRTIALPKLLVESLKAHRLRQLQERMLMGPRWVESDLVFTTRTGTPIEPRNFVRHFHLMRERAGLRYQRVHDLRHCAGSLLIAQGVHSRVVQEILGHSTPAMTNRYTHVVPASVREAAERMNVALGGGSA